MGQVIPLSPEAEARQRPTGKVSYEEFLELYDGTHAEWVSGEIETGQPPTYEHQADSRFLTTLLSMYVEAKGIGEILAAPFQMRLTQQERGREPDLLFVATPHLDRIKRTYLDGAADLAIEIVSPESFARDRGDKFVEYESAGVREYWLIDPQRRQAEFYQLDDDKHFQLVLSGKQGKFQSRVVEGFYLNIEWLWKKPLPNVAAILKEMGIL